MEAVKGCDNCKVMVQAWWAAGLAVPVVLIRGLVTNNNKAKQEESQNDRLPAAVTLCSTTHHASDVIGHPSTLIFQAQS